MLAHLAVAVDVDVDKKGKTPLYTGNAMGFPRGTNSHCCTVTASPRTPSHGVQTRVVVDREDLHEFHKRQVVNQEAASPWSRNQAQKKAGMLIFGFELC